MLCQLATNFAQEVFQVNGLEEIKNVNQKCLQYIDCLNSYVNYFQEFLNPIIHQILQSMLDSVVSRMEMLTYE